MRKPALTADVFVAALACLAVGCSRSERATAAPDTPAAIAPPPAAASAAPGDLVPPTAAAPPTPAATTAPTTADKKSSVDAGREAPAPAPKGQMKPGAACGASGCSPDMKKGNK